MAGPMVVFVEGTRELRSRPEYFLGQGVPNTLSWDVRRGSAVNAGDSLGTIEWPGLRSATIVAPSGCVGTITYLNDLVNVSDLLNQPQTFLRL